MRSPSTWLSFEFLLLSHVVFRSPLRCNKVYRSELTLELKLKPVMRLKFLTIFLNFPPSPMYLATTGKFFLPLQVRIKLSMSGNELLEEQTDSSHRTICQSKTNHRDTASTVDL